MNRLQFRALVLGILFVAGCSANNMETLTRDRAAVYMDVADYMMQVVDESSADYFLKTLAPRLKSRLDTNKNRVDMWEKYASEDQKGAFKRLNDAIVQSRAAAIEFHQDLFESDSLYFAAGETIAAQNRCVKEQTRISFILNELVAAGESCPQLSKCTTAAKDLGVLGDK